MNPELPLVILPPAGWLLWTWGGLNWKPARRVAWPAVVALAAIAYHISVVRILGTALLMFTTLTIGYGDDSTIVNRLKSKSRAWAIAGASYTLSLVLLGINFWTVATGVYFPLGMLLSNKWWPRWTHKYVEGFTGIFQGLAVAKRLSGV